MKMPASTAPAELVADLLDSMGVPGREPAEVRAADDAFTHGRVTAFDPAQFGDAAPHAFLSDYAGRCRDSGTAGLDALRRFIAPDVPANCGRFVEYALYDEPDSSSDHPPDDRGEFAADFPTLRNPPHQLVTQRIADRSLAVEVDENTERLGTGWQQVKVAALRARLDRERLRRTLTLLVAGAVHAGKTWDGDASDPDADVADALDAQPLRATRIVYGPGAWARRQRASGASLPLERLAGIFGVEEVQVVRAQVGRPGGSQVLFFCAADGLSRNDFSHLKTFTAPSRTGGRYAAYVSRAGDKRWRIGVECHETLALTSIAGLGVLETGDTASFAGA